MKQSKLQVIGIYMCKYFLSTCYPYRLAASRLGIPQPTCPALVVGMFQAGSTMSYLIAT